MGEIRKSTIFKISHMVEGGNTPNVFHSLSANWICATDLPFFCHVPQSTNNVVDTREVFYAHEQYTQNIVKSTLNK